MSCSERQLTDEAKTGLWSNVYEKCDAFEKMKNASPTALQDWLRMWYRFKVEKRENGCSEEYSSDDVYTEELEDYGVNESTERTALVTGPVGSGKSTIVKQVAARLGSVDSRN